MPLPFTNILDSRIINASFIGGILSFLITKLFEVAREVGGIRKKEKEALTILERKLNEVLTETQGNTQKLTTYKENLEAIQHGKFMKFYPSFWEPELRADSALNIRNMRIVNIASQLGIHLSFLNSNLTEFKKTMEKFFNELEACNLDAPSHQQEIAILVGSVPNLLEAIATHTKTISYMLDKGKELIAEIRIENRRFDPGNDLLYRPDRSDASPKHKELIKQEKEILVKESKQILEEQGLPVPPENQVFRILGLFRNPKKDKND